MSLLPGTDLYQHYIQIKSKYKQLLLPFDAVVLAKVYTNNWAKMKNFIAIAKLYWDNF